MDVSQPTREAGIIVRVESNIVIDITGFTAPAIYGYAPDNYEDASNPVQILVTEAAPPPTTQHAPLIYKTGSAWINNRAIGNDELSNSIILASGTATVPSGVNSTINIVHNLNMASYRVLLQPINMSSPGYTITGLDWSVNACEIWPINQVINDFDVISDSETYADFYWAVIS
jgi:hypothetical protein